MRKRKIISESMLFIVGMMAGKIIFQGIGIENTILIGIGIFTILWMIWDSIAEKERRKRRKQKKAA